MVKRDWKFLKEGETALFPLDLCPPFPPLFSLATSTLEKYLETVSDLVCKTCMRSRELVNLDKYVSYRGQ